jgi:hypothetical protein
VGWRQTGDDSVLSHAQPDSFVWLVGWRVGVLACWRVKRSGCGPVLCREQRTCPRAHNSIPDFCALVFGNSSIRGGVYCTFRSFLPRTPALASRQSPAVTPARTSTTSTRCFRLILMFVGRTRDARTTPGPPVIETSTPVSQPTWHRARPAAATAEA